MGKIINYQIDAEGLYDFAVSAFREGNYILCVQNINEGLSSSNLDKQVKSKFYELLMAVYDNTENSAAKMDIVVKNAPEPLGDYGKIDFREFITVDDTLLMSDEEEENNEIFIYSQIRDCFTIRDYVKAFGQIITAELSEKYLIKLSEYICLAFEEDETFNINDYFVPAISLLAKLEDKNRLLSVMIASGGACKDLVIDGASVFAEDADDLVKLLSLAEVYYISGEMDVAKDIYKKALQFSPLNEDALFHYAAILYAKGYKVEADKYFAKYRVLFENTFLPINMYAKYFESEYVKTTPVLYPYLDANFVDEEARCVIENIQLNGLDGSNLRGIAEVINTCEKEEDCFILPLLSDILTKDKLHATLLYLLGNPSINSFIKRKLIAKLYDAKYQGRYIAYLDSKLVFASMVEIGPNHSEYYANLYREFVLEMPFSSINIPLKCNVLKNVIKKVEQLIPLVEYQESRYIAYLVLKNYIKLCKIIVEWSEIENLLRIDKEYVPKFFAKYGITKWIIK
ncbi:MAG TPA: hypothetical protein VJ903_04745 [Clostridia bacterium]|nr:hypothetical protein [Clostridia bacterium]